MILSTIKVSKLWNFLKLTSFSVLSFFLNRLYHKLQHVFKVRMNLDSRLIKRLDVR